MSTKTIGSTIAIRDLRQDEREQMFNLLGRYYLGVTRAAFERDLAAKEHVILLRTSTGEIVGFSTLSRFHLALPDRTVLAIFSGDTIVGAGHRGSFETAHQICRYFFRTIHEFPGEEIDWVLICKGWRTYRVLRLLFVDYSPRAGGVDRAAFREVADAFGAARYPGLYRTESGIIESPVPGQRILPKSPEAIDPRRSDPEMLFFEQANPQHERGNELVCIAPIRPDNFTAATRRLAGYSKT
jgi:hypothetical protein